MKDLKCVEGRHCDSLAASLREGKFKFEPALLRLRIDLVSHPASGGGAG